MIIHVEARVVYDFDTEDVVISEEEAISMVESILLRGVAADEVTITATTEMSPDPGESQGLGS